MDLKQLRYFVMVAEELSFSRAAARLHISQPPLSQQIKALEEEMGVTLLVRDRRSVRLSDAGVVFLRESRLLLDQFRSAVNSAVRASQTNAGSIRLGVATSGLFSVMPKFQELMRTHFPNVEVLVSDMQSDDQVRAVSQGALDIGIAHVKPERMNVGRKQVFSEGLSVVLPVGHPQAERADLSLADLADEPMVALSREHAPTVFDAVIASCAAAGFSPVVKHSARNPMTIFQMVRAGFGIALVPRSYRHSAYPGVRFRDVLPAVGQVRLEMIWSERHASELTLAVIGQLVAPLIDSLGTEPQPG
ncbi:LysR substrate-binding domain-containing protein [Variovorax saccharolyticus]|uniref:LysR substrate-binding domain-containing protein n=1 Tax=Variovorax saccharolyticus TaxID=3053516 RepID=UPI002578DD2C|nr:LysR substrate-binding domain-containing protein [Variovorax sp. J31P216]MDM0026671.1 LysR substrate-binding domain-containing protein [Variovorax sp. J31P216]